jgi:hypothetical protein
METRLSHIAEVPTLSGPSTAATDPIKPELFVGKHEAQIGKLVSLTQFGVNVLTLDPGAVSSLRHWHEGEDEFVSCSYLSSPGGSLGIVCGDQRLGRDFAPSLDKQPI